MTGTELDVLTALVRTHGAGPLLEELAVLIREDPRYPQQLRATAASRVLRVRRLLRGDTYDGS